MIINPIFVAENGEHVWTFPTACPELYCGEWENVEDCMVRKETK